MRALNNSRYEKKGDISVTTLIDSPKVSLLREMTNYEEDVIDMLWAMFGSATHEVLERGIEQIIKFEQSQGIEPRFLSEFRMLKEILGWNVSGTTDLFQIDQEIVYDYKVTTVWKLLKCDKTLDPITGNLINKTNSELKSWNAQLNCYAHMLRDYGYNPKFIRIITILKDWKSGDVARRDNYPKSPIEIVDIPVQPAHMMQGYMESRVKLHQTYRQIAIEKGIDFVPECTPKDRWQTPNTLKFYNGSAKRSTKNFEINTEQDRIEAMEWYKNQVTTTPGLYPKEFPGESRRCESYCPVNKHCHFYLNQFEKF